MSKETEDLLDNIHNLLWLLDFYPRHDWAPGYLGVECGDDPCKEAGVTEKGFWCRAHG